MRMEMTLRRGLFLLGLPVLFAFGETPCVEVPVEISNPGFEEGKAGWQFLPNMSVSSERPHGGKFCACVDMTTVDSSRVYLTRMFPVEAGAEYGAECFVRTEDVQSDARIRQGSCGATLIVEWCNADRKWIDIGQYAKSVYGTEDWAKDGDKLVTWWAKTVEGRMTAILVNTAETPASVEVDLPLVGRRRYGLGRFEVRTVTGS